MSKGYIKLAVLFLLLFYNIVEAQISEKDRIINILNKSEAFYNNTKAYSLDSRYRLYVNHTSNEIKEEYTGVTIKQDNNVYNRIATTEMIGIGKSLIKIDNKNKRIKVFRYNTSSNEMSTIKDFKNYLQYFTIVKLTENQSQWICTLETGKISMVPFSKVVLYLKKSNYQIERQDLFYLTKYKTRIVKGVPNYEMPRLVVSFSNFKNKVEDKNCFDKSSYIKVKGGKIYPSKKYASYTIVD